MSRDLAFYHTVIRENRYFPTVIRDFKDQSVSIEYYLVFSLINRVGVALLDCECSLIAEVIY